MTRHISQRFVYPDDRAIVRPFDWRQIYRLLGYMKPHIRLTIMAFIVTMVGVATRLLIPFLIAKAIDEAIASHSLNMLQGIVLILLMLHLIQYAAGRLRMLLTNWAGQLALRDLRQQLFAHVTNLSFEFYDRRSAGSILVRIVNDVNALQDLLTNGVVNTLMDILVIIGITIIMFSLHWQLALAAMSVVPIMFLLSTRVRGAIRRNWREVRMRSARINSHLNEAIQGMRVTEAFVQERENQEFFSYMNNDYRETFNRSSKVSDVFHPLVEVTGSVGVCIVYWFGATLCLRGEMSVGMLVAFTSYMNQFWQPISRLGNLYNQLLQAMASSERIFEYLDTKPTVVELPNAKHLPTLRGDVCYKDVYFSYTKNRHALHGVSLSVASGQTVALVGPTGSGKTTMVNLLCRFYDATSGSVTVDGFDVRDVTLASLRSQIGVVLQDAFLFSGTIIDNIRYGKLEASDDEVIAAAQIIGADEFITSMPRGYYTKVNERGSGLSQGQRQLISFTRAILHDPRILVLDEATASIDTETELHIQTALQKLLQGRTSFVVAHRLSTIRNAELIVVLDHGRIVQTGNHDSLVNEPGIYQDLIQAQFLRCS